MALSGSLFSFASFSGDLKARFGFSSSNINLLSAIGDTSMYVGFLIVGPIYDRYGGQWTLVTASALTFLGYGGMFAAYAQAWGGLGLLIVLYALAGIASTAGYLAALATNMANFSDASSGTVSGVLLPFFGLSASLFSQIKTQLFSGKDELVDLSEVFQGQEEDAGKVDPAVEISKDITKDFEIEHISRSSTIAPGANGEYNVLEYSSPKITEAKNHPLPSQHDEPARYNPFLTPVEMRPKQVVVSATFWFFVLAQLLQQGFSYINNIDSIVEAVLDLDNPPSHSKAVALTGLHVTLISVGNCAGRLISGIVSDWAVQRFQVSRSIFFLFSEVLILVPLAMMSNFFGIQYFGTNSGLVMVLNGLNPIVANQIYAVFYDRASVATPTMSKRKATEKEPEDVEMASHEDDDSGSDGDEDIINVDFEFFDPKEIDFHAVKNLLNQYFASDAILFGLSELSEMIISQSNVGTTIKVNGVESDPYALLTVLNMNQHLYNIHKPATAASSESGSGSAPAAPKPSDAMKQIRDYVFVKSKQNEKLHTKLKELLGAGSKKEVGLILSERFINMPVETAPPMWRMMLEEVKWAVDEGLPFNFEYYLLISPTYHEVAPKIDLDDEAPKPAKKKSKAAEPATFFFHPEEEMLQQYAEFTQDFKLTTPSTVAESKNTFEDYGIVPARRMMLIHKDKIPEVVQLMTNNSQW
ncbi:Mss4p nuclear export [Podila horticola]|nr:Mss4p nuclear export [Podila horticola]